MRISPTASEEREFEKDHISKQEEVYLKTDVIERVEFDPGYAAKVGLIENFLGQHGNGGFVLDIGSNTGGEPEFLAHRGFRMVATDINEIALGYSLKRATQFRKEKPSYYAADVHSMPFRDGIFENATAFEVLHHFENLKPALSEIFRVLEPGGSLFTFEPYALNPYRRLAELRFYFMGSIERSFTVSALRNQLEAVGFEIVSIRKQVLPPSEWKMRQVTGFRRFLKKFYHAVGKRMVFLFGNLVIVAKKPGSKGNSEASDLEECLQCPKTAKQLRRCGGRYITSGEGENYAYPIAEGVPVLIAEDAARLAD